MINFKWIKNGTKEQLNKEIEIFTIKEEKNVVNPDAFILTGMKKINEINDDTKKDLIFDAVCKYYGKERHEIIEKNRKREVLEPRQLIQYLLKKETKYSLAFIGKKVGNKDHATVLHSHRTWSNLIETSKPHRYAHSKVMEYYEYLTKELKENLETSSYKGSEDQKADHIIANWERFKHLYSN